jgi:predicted nucleic acid-binding protein
LHAERPRFFRDGLILSTAAARELTVVTRHVKDFADCGVEVIDLWG